MLGAWDSDFRFSGLGFQPSRLHRVLELSAIVRTEHPMKNQWFPIQVPLICLGTVLCEPIALQRPIAEHK